MRRLGTCSSTFVNLHQTHASLAKKLTTSISLNITTEMDVLKSSFNSLSKVTIKRKVNLVNQRKYKRKREIS